MDLEYSMWGVPNFNVWQAAYDGTMVWGKIQDTPVYVRTFEFWDGLDLIADKGAKDVQEFAKCAKGMVCAIARDLRSDDCYAYVFEPSSVVNSIRVPDLVPAHAEWFGMVDMWEDGKVPSIIMLRLAANVYVPFNKYYGNRWVPVLWDNEFSGVEEGTHLDCQIGIFKKDRMDLSGCEGILRDIESAFPFVDPGAAAGNEVVNVVLKLDGSDVFYIGLNKNHAPYNGYTDSLRGCLPIILREMCRRYYNIMETNILSYLNGQIDRDEVKIVIWVSDGDVQSVPYAMRKSGSNVTVQLPKDRSGGFERVYVENPMMAAVRGTVGISNQV